MKHANNAATGGNVTLLGKQVQIRGLAGISITQDILQNALVEMASPNTHLRIAA